MPYRILRLFIVIACMSGALHAQYPGWNSLEIATDYNTCMQGVKDTSGTWLIQPKYEYLTATGAVYIAGYGGRYGVIDTNGREFIPMIYESVYALGSWSWWGTVLKDYYVVTRNGKQGVVDSANQPIVPIRYEQIQATPDSVILAREGKTWEFYYLKGTHFTSPWKSKRGPEWLGEHRYRFRKKTIFGKKYGVVGDSGQIIVEQKYDHIDGYPITRTFMLTRNNKYGYCSDAGKMLWPISFKWDKNERWYGNSFRLVGSSGVGPAQLNGKQGLISVHGDTILPFIYDDIEAFNLKLDNRLWSVSINGLSGIYDHIDGWKLAPVYSEITRVKTYTSEKDSGAVGLLVAKRDGQWGAVLTSGQIVVPFNNTDMHREDEMNYIFLRGDSLLQLHVGTSWSRMQVVARTVANEPYPSFKWPYGEQEDAAPADQEFRIFQGKNGVTAFYHPGHANGDFIYHDTAHPFNTGNYYGMSLPDSIVFATAFFTKPLTKPWTTGEVFSVYSIRSDLYEKDTLERYPSICIRKRKDGNSLTAINEIVYLEYGSEYYLTLNSDVVRSDGKLIINGDSVMQTTAKRHGHDGSLFFVTKKYLAGTGFVFAAHDTLGRMQVPDQSRDISDFTDRYCWSPAKEWNEWQLTDRKSGKNILGQKMFSENPSPVWDSITIAENKKNGVRLFNADRQQYLTAYGFNNITALNMEGTVFAVMTCSRHIGVMDAGGHWLLDTVYNFYTPVDEDTAIVLTNPEGEGEYRRTFCNHYVFYNADTQIVFNAATQKAENRERGINVLWKQVVVVPDSAKLETLPAYYHWLFRRHLNLYLQGGEDSTFTGWQQQCIVDSVYSPRRSWDMHHELYDPACSYCKARGALGLGYSWNPYEENAAYQVEYRSDSLVSFYRLGSTRSLDFRKEDRYWFSNVMMFDDGPRQLTIDSLFNPASDWRNFLINTVISYVNNHNNIDGDCHNPAGIPKMLSQTFLVSADGLRLYPEGFQENWSQLVITIPWKDVDPYLRDDMRRKLPVHK